MKVPTTDLRGIDPAQAQALIRQGIQDSEQLLERTRTPNDRGELARAIGATPGQVLELANRADLARIRGIGRVFSDLLEEAGVDTVAELAQRSPANLQATLMRINLKRKLTGIQPTLEMVQDWISQAQLLPKILEY